MGREERWGRRWELNHEWTRIFVDDLGMGTKETYGTGTEGSRTGRTGLTGVEGRGFSTRCARLVGGGLHGVP